MTTGKQVLVINGNPDPSPDRLTSALATAYLQGATDAGYHVRRINVGDLDFTLLRSATAFAARPTGTILRAQEAFLAADHVVFVYPFWLGGPPALLKGFMEQLACGQFLLGENKSGFPKGQLKGRSASVIVTMGAPPIPYRLMFGHHGIKAFNSGILSLAGFSPVRTHVFGGKMITPPNTSEAISKVQELGRRLA